jgi:alpha-tubulin suppressor-like RCC1 family protein
MCAALAGCGRFGFAELGGAGSDGANGSSDDADQTNGVMYIAQGGKTACALLGTGDVWCWGNGNLGNLARSDDADSSVPVHVEGIQLLTLDMNDGGSIGFARGGGAYAWGPNPQQQFGTGTAIPLRAPTSVPYPAMTVEVSIGEQMLCSVTNTNVVSCAGGAEWLGDGGSAQRSELGVVPGLAAFDVIAGDKHVCARTTTEGASCWGDNQFGQLGDGTTNASSVPTVGPAGPWEKIVPGDNHTCAMYEGGVSCWGDNDVGELGDGSTGPIRRTAGPVPGISDARDLISYAGGSCVLTAAHDVFCWGDNSRGQLGVVGGGPFSRVPVMVQGLPPALAIASRTDVSICALTEAREVYCWGDNSAGQLGQGVAGDPSEMPLRVMGLP